MKRHLIGIGGVGMSALATALHRLGDTVTGADRNLATDNIRFLTGLGIRCFPDDGSGVDAETDEIIVSTAIEADNPALAKAKELGIPVTHRAKALARALAGRKLVAVVGTCGKSTVTAMLGHILAECGLDPICVNGANVPGWEGAVRFGAGQFAVAEVDESDKSLVAFHPYAAIVTNASADHYSKEEMDAVFDAFIKDLPGPVVDGRVDAKSVRVPVDAKSVRVSVDAKSVRVPVDAKSVRVPVDAKSVRVPVDAESFPRQKEESSVLTGRGQGPASTEVPTSMPGRHNRQNAALALRMALALGCNEAEARAALLDFRGVHRRLQRVDAKSVRVPVDAKSVRVPVDAKSVRVPVDAKSTGPAVFDDYAHNPEKLHAMWTTLAEEYPQGICVVWRPHGYAPLRKMMDALAAMFNGTIRPQDKLLLLPVYDAGGTTDRSVNSDALLAKINPGLCELVPTLDAAYDWIAAHVGSFGALATAGARDPDLPKLAARLAEFNSRV